MKLIIWDLIQADEYATVYLSKDSSRNLKVSTRQLYSKVFYRNQVSAETFETSLGYYRSHPLFEKVLLDSLQLFANRMREKSFERKTAMLPVLSDTIISK